MSNSRMVLSGFDELKAALRALPKELTGEASHEVQGAANTAAVAVRTVYGQHRVTGHLQNAVTVEPLSAGQFGAGVQVKVNDPIAWLFDNGSQARHWVRGKSTGTMWGKTPPTHIFVRTMIAQRRKMYQALKGVLERAGLRVSGDA